MACVGGEEQGFACIAGHDKGARRPGRGWRAGADGRVVNRPADRAEFIAHERSCLRAGGWELYQGHVDHLGAEPLLDSFGTLVGLFEQEHFNIGMGACEVGYDFGQERHGSAGDGSDANPARDQARGGVRLSSDGVERGENLARVGDGPFDPHQLVWHHCAHGQAGVHRGRAQASRWSGLARIARHRDGRRPPGRSLPLRLLPMLLVVEFPYMKNINDKYILHRFDSSRIFS